MVPFSESRPARRGRPARAPGPAPGTAPGCPSPPEPITRARIEHYVARGRRLQAEAVAGMARRAGAALARPFRRSGARAGAAEATVVAVAHELRTPLTTIRSFSEILRDNPDIPRDQRIRFLDTILEESDRLNRSIGRVVDCLSAGPNRGAGAAGPAD